MSNEPAQPTRPPSTRSRMSRLPSPQLQQPSPSHLEEEESGSSYVPWHIRNPPSPPRPVYAPENHPSSSSSLQPQPQPHLQHRPAPSTPANQRARFEETSTNNNNSNNNPPYPISNQYGFVQPQPQPPFISRTKPPSLSRSSSSSSLASSRSTHFVSSGSERDWSSDEKRRRDRKARKLGKSLSEIALEAVEEEKGRKRERNRRVWKWIGWSVGGVLEGWCLWVMIRYFVAFLLFLDDTQRRRFNLAFFIVSLYSCLTTLLPLMYLLPLFPTSRPSRLLPIAHLLLALSSLSILAIAAVQLILFKLWENEPAPRGFVGRCGWDMDSVWGSPSECGSYRWEGWVGVLSARLGGSFVLIVLLHLSIIRYMANSPLSIQLPPSPGAGYRSSQQSLLPTTLIDRHHPRLLSEEFHRPQHHRQNSQPRSHHRSKRSTRTRGATSSSARYHDESHSEPEMVETSNRRDEQRFQTGYLRPLGRGGEQEEDGRYFGRPQTYVDLSEDPRTGPWSSSSAWGASAGRSFVGGRGGVEDPLSTPVAAYISRKPVRYVSSASSHASSTRVRGGEGSDFYHDQEEDNEGDVDDSDAYTPAPTRISRTTPTFGFQLLPPSTSTSTSPRQYKSNLPSLVNSPSSSNRTTLSPPPPDSSPPPPPTNDQAKFVPPSRAPPKPPISIDTTLRSDGSLDPVDAFPSPPGISFHRSPPQLSSDPNSNPYAYQYHSGSHGLISPPSSDETSSSPSNHFSSHSHSFINHHHATAPSPPPPREAPDLMLGSVWDEEYEEEEEEFGGGRRGGVGGMEMEMEMGGKRLSTIQSETEREE